MRKVLAFVLLLIAFVVIMPISIGPPVGAANQEVGLAVTGLGANMILPIAFTTDLVYGNGITGNARAPNIATFGLAQTSSTSIGTTAGNARAPNPTPNGYMGMMQGILSGSSGAMAMTMLGIVAVAVYLRPGLGLMATKLFRKLSSTTLSRTRRGGLHLARDHDNGWWAFSKALFHRADLNITSRASPDLTIQALSP